MTQEDLQKSVDRRTVVNTAAWAVPVIAVGVAAPFASASCQGGGTFTAPVPQSGNVGSESTRVSFTVPRGVRRISFDVLGGAGGGTSSGRPYGDGRRVQGNLTVTPGEVLTFVTGQGGIFTGNSSAIGGQGYGNGGDVTIPSAGLAGFQFGGSGGGGSAILRGSAPLVVAGGGGGRGASKSQFPQADPAFSDLSTATENAGRQGTSARFVEVGHGSPASGATAGAGATYWSREGNVLVDSGLVVGNSGGSAAGGANGGAGVFKTIQRDGAVFAASSGGGGGGYRGGGSGAAAGYRWDPSGTFGYAVMAMAGAGGNASSFAATSTSNVNFSTGENANGGTDNRAPGRVRVTWSC